MNWFTSDKIDYETFLEIKYLHFPVSMSVILQSNTHMTYNGEQARFTEKKCLIKQLLKIIYKNE